MGDEGSRFSTIIDRLLAGELSRPEAADAILSLFEQTKQVKQGIGFSIDLNDPEFSDSERRTLQGLFDDLQTLMAQRLSGPRGTA